MTFTTNSIQLILISTLNNYVFHLEILSTEETNTENDLEVIKKSHIFAANNEYGNLEQIITVKTYIYEKDCLFFIIDPIVFLFK